MVPRCCTFKPAAGLSSTSSNSAGACSSNLPTCPQATALRPPPASMQLHHRSYSSSSHAKCISTSPCPSAHHPRFRTLTRAASPHAPDPSPTPHMAPTPSPSTPSHPHSIPSLTAHDGAWQLPYGTVMPSRTAVMEQYGWMLETPLDQLMARAAAVRDSARHSAVVTFSPKVFLPLTRLCRDTCAYCTFAQPPRPGRRAYMTLEEVLQVCRLGAAQGCSEALFTLGDKPEERWREAAEELAGMGYRSTLDYVESAARAVLRETGLLPHINAGVMGPEDILRLKKVSASQGLMLESTSEALLAPGGPHAGCPDKHPAVRLATIEAAGEAAVPYTSGLLLGLGDTRHDVLHGLACLATLHRRYGHIQELILQNFRAKGGTPMAASPEPPLEELLWAVAAARLMVGPDVNIQAPPNLTPPAAGPGGAGGGSAGESAAEALQAASWRALLDAGINDWGGISPVTRDFVNPERPWPHLAPLAQATAAAGRLLLPRLPLYPAWVGLAGDGGTAVGPGGGAGVGHADVGGGREAGAGAGEADEAAGRQRQSAGVRAGPAAGAGAGAGTWLDFSGGRESVGAAVLRAADSEGFLRASGWVAGRGDGVGKEEGNGEGLVDEGAALCAVQGGQQGHGLQQGLGSCTQDSGPAAEAAGAAAGAAAELEGEARRRSTPLPSTASVRRRPGGGWRVEVGADGAVAGVEAPGEPRPVVQRLLDGVLEGGRPLQQPDIELLLRCRAADFAAVVGAADRLRRTVCGDTVSYVVNRNINYTNVCTYKCSFCAFSKGKAAEALRGPPYVVPYDEIARRAAEAWDRGATEVCMQGGIHPDFDGRTYERILSAVRQAAPAMHVHAFSPLEVHHGATSLGLSYERYLERLERAGLGSLPGTAAEVLHDGVRAVLCPDKIDTATWLEVVSAAHRVGLRTTSTLMFGSVEEGPSTWAAHLVALRELQQRAESRQLQQQGGEGRSSSGSSSSRGVGLTEFVPLPFVHMEAPVYLQGRARRGPTLHEGVLLHAVARLALHPHVTNIQASWVKMGPQQAGALLAAGCNDMGGSIMNESITRAAGASYGQELPPPAMEAVIRAAGRQPRQRTTLYGTPPAEQVAKSYGAGPLAPLVYEAPSSGALR